MIKKMCAFFVAIILAMSCAVVVFAISNETEILPAFEYNLGDVNMDKTVNVKDATTLQKHIAGIVTLSDKQLILADSDQNANVNIKDATYIQKQVAGLVPPAVFKPIPETTSEALITSSHITSSTEADKITSSEDLTSAPVSTEVTSSVPGTSEITSQTPIVTTEVPTSKVTVPTTEIPTTVTPTQIPTHTTTEAPTQKPTRDPDKPIELPFVPIM